jgi:hypothetical protein
MADTNNTTRKSGDDITQKSSNLPVLATPAPSTDPILHFPSSDAHIQTLQRKLESLTARNGLGKRSEREPSSRDLVHDLCAVREAHMQRFLDTDNVSGDGAQVWESSVSDDTSAFSLLHRKLYPEKQAVSAEELVVLVDDDSVAKCMESMESEHTRGDGSNTTNSTT